MRKHRKSEHGIKAIEGLLKDAEIRLDKIAARRGRLGWRWDWRFYMNLRCQLTDIRAKLSW